MPSSEQLTHPIVGIVSAALLPQRFTGRQPEPAPGARPFITVSNQPGTRAADLAEPLATRLSGLRLGGGRWHVFDRQLVEKVASDHQISRRLIERMQDRAHSLLLDSLSGLSMRGDGAVSPIKVYRRVATTIRALAEAGRVVLCGRGGVFVTRGLPGGVSVRLVAPMEFRVAEFQRRLGCDAATARAEVATLDANHRAFFRKYWPNETLGPESFNLTFNVAEMEVPTMIEAIVPLVQRAMQRAAQAAYAIDEAERALG